MHIYARLDVDAPSITLLAPTHVDPIFAVSSSEAAALPNGQRALTPIIAGSISGTCVVVGWIVAAIAALVKRHKRKKELKAIGRMDLLHEVPKPQAFIVPPDPAVLQGQHEPGEHIHFEKKRKNGKGKMKDEALRLLPRREEPVEEPAEGHGQTTAPMKPLPEVPDEDQSMQDGSSMAGATEKSGLPSGLPSFERQSQPASPLRTEHDVDGLPAASDFAYPPGYHNRTPQR